MAHALLTAYIAALDAEERAERALADAQKNHVHSAPSPTYPPTVLRQAVQTARAGATNAATEDLGVIGAALLEQDARAAESVDTEPLEAAVTAARAARVAAAEALYTAARAAAA